jgi:hypothetical protein
MRILAVRVAHDRLLQTRKEFLRLRGTKSLPSLRLFRDRLDAASRMTLTAKGRRSGDTLEWMVGRAAAECSPWWRNQLRWYLKGGDKVLEPRGSYLSPDDAPKQLFVWHQFDYWIRVALKDRPSHLDRSRAIAATLAVFAGPGLFRPPDLEQFARNIVERWRVRKASRSEEFARQWFRSSMVPLSMIPR